MSVQLAFVLGLLVAGAPLTLLCLVMRADSRMWRERAESYNASERMRQEALRREEGAVDRLARWRADHADFVAMAERLDAQDDQPKMH